MAAARRGDVTPASGAVGRASERGPDPKRRTVGPAQAQRSWMPEEVPSISGRGPRGEGGGGGEGKNGVGASAVLQAENPVNPGAPGFERRLRGLSA